MPLWVMVELLSFTKLSTLYYAMYETEQVTIARMCGKTREVMSNHLHVLTVLRNRCCHGGRLYNTAFRPSAKLGPYYLPKHPEVKCDTLFAAVLVLFRCLPFREDRVTLHKKLCDCITRYSTSINLDLIGFPENYQQLLNYEVNTV